LDFGLLLPTRELVMNRLEHDFASIVDLAVEAEAGGFDSAWVGDSIIARPRFEPLTTLAAVATKTERIQLGTAVLISALRNPVVLANEVANLDLIARGRLVLGLGTSARNPANQREFEAVGVPFARRIGIFEEGLEVMQRLWTEPKASFVGRHFRFEDVSLGLRPFDAAGIPVWLSASEDNSFRRVLRRGQGWLILAASGQAFASAWRRLQELAAEEQRDISALGRAVYVTLDIDDDAVAADGRMRQFVESYYGGRYEALTRIHAVCAGPADKCIEWLSGFVAAGANTLIVRFNQRDQVGQMQRFSRDVMPALRA
jgi:alkanesulfonate monooxygenase SsuD/methylene tetrahydromethanopterin reductase-like flavin-dependent oxidoreductase (luciferase family)